MALVFDSYIHNPPLLSPRPRDYSNAPLLRPRLKQKTASVLLLLAERFRRIKHKSKILNKFRSRWKNKKRTNEEREKWKPKANPGTRSAINIKMEHTRSFLELEGEEIHAGHRVPCTQTQRLVADQNSKHQGDEWRSDDQTVPLPEFRPRNSAFQYCYSPVSVTWWQPTSKQTKKKPF